MALPVIQNRNINQDFYVWALTSAYRSGYRIYNPDLAESKEPDAYEIIRRDPIVAKAIDIRLHSIAGRKWTTQPKTSSKKHRLAASIVEDGLKEIEHFSEARYEQGQAVMRGQSFSEIQGHRKIAKLGEIMRRWWIPKKLKDIDRRRFRFAPRHFDKTDGGDGFSVVLELFSLERQRWEIVEHPEFYLKTVFNDEEGRLGYGRGLMESAYYYVWLKGQCLTEKLGGIQRWARGMIHMKVDGLRAASTGKTNEVIRTDTLNALKKFYSSHHLITDKQDNVEVHETTGTGDALTMEFIRYLDDAMTSLILGSSLPYGGSAGEGGGSLARAGEEANTTESLIQFDREKLAQDVTRDVVGLFWRCNRENLQQLGLTEFDMPTFEVSQERRADPAKAITVITSALSAGISLRRDEVYEQIGMTPPNEDDIVIEGMSQMPAMPGMPGAPGADDDAGAQDGIPGGGKGGSALDKGRDRIREVQDARRGAAQNAEAGGNLSARDAFDVLKAFSNGLIAAINRQPPPPDVHVHLTPPTGASKLANWEEAKHPREASGEFAPKGGGGGGDVAVKDDSRVHEPPPNVGDDTREGVAERDRVIAERKVKWEEIAHDRKARWREDIDKKIREEDAKVKHLPKEARGHVVEQVIEREFGIGHDQDRNDARRGALHELIEKIYGIKKRGTGGERTVDTKQPPPPKVEAPAAPAAGPMSPVPWNIPMENVKRENFPNTREWILEKKREFGRGKREIEKRLKDAKAMGNPLNTADAAIQKKLDAHEARRKAAHEAPAAEHKDNDGRGSELTGGHVASTSHPRPEDFAIPHEQAAHEFVKSLPKGRDLAGRLAVIGGDKSDQRAGARQGNIGRTYWVKDEKGEKVGVFKHIKRDRMFGGIKEWRRELGNYRLAHTMGFGASPAVVPMAAPLAQGREMPGAHAGIAEQGHFMIRGKGEPWANNPINPREVDLDSLQQVIALDVLTGNSDRHDNNFMVNKNNRLIAIDNGFAWAHGDEVGFHGYSSGPKSILASRPKGDAKITPSMKAMIAKLTPDKVKGILEPLGLGPKALKATQQRLQVLQGMTELTEDNFEETAKRMKIRFVRRGWR